MRKRDGEEREEVDFAPLARIPAGSTLGNGAVKWRILPPISSSSF